ncbi:IclR family transcriptional regulator [Ramlibacter sp.]|uniref:IclR family transcriptional regulator n=1 Tax=Ramlibacter sp. TaxID=1917967 RepID=UPI003D12FEA9
MTTVKDRMADDAGPMSPARTLRVLEVIAGVPGGLSLAELGAQLEIPKTSLFNLLRPLVAQNYLAQTDRKYLAGPALFRLALATSKTSMFASLQPLMARLAGDVGETVSLSVLHPHEGELEYVEVVESTRSVRYVVRPGVRRPLYCVSSGFVLMAWQPPQWTQDYLRDVELTQFTASTLTDRASVLKRVEEVRERGFVVSNGEFSEEVYGFAAPVFSSPGHVVASLGIGAPSSRAFQKKEAYLAALVAAAGEMSDLFGGRGRGRG